MGLEGTEEKGSLKVAPVVAERGQALAAKRDDLGSIPGTGRVVGEPTPRVVL